MNKHIVVAALLLQVVVFGSLASAQTTESPAAVNLPPPKPAPEFSVQSCSVTSQSVVMNCGGSCASDARIQELEQKVNRLMATVGNCCNVSGGVGSLPTPTPGNLTRSQDCKGILDNDETTPSGVYMIYPQDNLGGFMVYCDMDNDGGGWTVFQRRLDGTVDFYRGWADYKNGFPSNLNGEFWLGNEKLHRLTAQGAYELRVDLEDADGNTAYAAYSSFSVASESDKYRLTVTGYSGTAGDAMNHHNGRRFSTKDSDNDGGAGHCARVYKGAWWYGYCHDSNLNGLYHLGPHSSRGDGVNWDQWRGYYHSLKRTVMKIRPTI